MHATLLALLLAPGAAAKPPPPLVLAESVPVETDLDDPELGDAADLWVAMIRKARTSLDISQFYVVREGEGPTRLDPVLEAIEEAARRGVEVRLLADAKFAGTYPDELERLGALDGIEVRLYDMKPLTGGVQHAKYFVVDGERAWLGSHNFDWRSLEHIQELGAAFTEIGAVGALSAVFDLDWSLAGGAERPPVSEPSPPPAPVTVPYGEGEVELLLAASPRDLLPVGVPWDLPLLVELIDGAEDRVRAQWLSYATITYTREYFDSLDSALRRADARGVEVQLIVSHWNKKPPKVRAVQSLAALEHVEVRFLSVPEHSGGFIDFARVVHSKYLVVDGRSSWVGTSNASGDYFTGSRNVGLVVHGAPLAADLDRYFERGWASPHAEPVDPAADYQAPRTHR